MKRRSTEASDRPGVSIDIPAKTATKGAVNLHFTQEEFRRGPLCLSLLIADAEVGKTDVKRVRGQFKIVDLRRAGDAGHIQTQNAVYYVKPADVDSALKSLARQIPSHKNK